MKHVGLFIPCYVDQLYPDVAKATLKILSQFDLNVDYPFEQTCCGQPMANTGCREEAKPVARRFIDIFKQYDYIVCPSGSCTSMVRNHYEGLTDGCDREKEVRSNTYELCEFLWDVLGVRSIKSKFPHKVGLHQSCHGLRELRLGSSSERVTPQFSKVRGLLENVEGIDLVDLERKDECCGFGGTFSVSEEAVSCQMGKDRLNDHLNSGTEYMTGVDMSCLMHLSGLSRRRKDGLQFKHVAEILASA